MSKSASEIEYQSALNMKRRRNRRNRFRRRVSFAVILLIICAVALTFFYKASYAKHKTVDPQVTIYRQVIQSKGYCLLNEKTYKSKGTGTIVFQAQEGEKVPKDFEIANINLMNDNTQIKDEIIKIQAAIDYLNEDEEPATKGQALDDKDLNLIRSIQTFARDREYEKLITSINNLDLNTQHTVNISELNELLKLDLEDLEAKKEKLSLQLSTTNYSYTADFPGIVSYKINDLKGRFSTAKGFDHFTYDYLNRQEIKNYESQDIHVKKNEPIFRLIENLNWYMAIGISDERLIHDIKEGDVLSLSIDTESPIKAVVRQMNIQEDGKSCLIMEFQDELAKYYDERVHDIKIIQKEEEALTIPSTAIVENDGVRGVYVQEVHGLVRFVPVEVIDETREEAYVSLGNESDEIIINDKPVRTLSVMDKVITSPTEVSDQQII